MGGGVGVVRGGRTGGQSRFLWGFFVVGIYIQGALSICIYGWGMLIGLGWVRGVGLGGKYCTSITLVSEEYSGGYGLFCIRFILAAPAATTCFGLGRDFGAGNYGDIFEGKA